MLAFPGDFLEKRRKLTRQAGVNKGLNKSSLLLLWLATPAPAAPQAAAAPSRPVQVKLVLLGESAVGKSSVVLRFCQNDFQANKEPTIGAAFLTQRCRLEDNVIKFEIWDTAGQERFRSLSPMYYRNSQASIVVYDVTKAASLEQAKTWVKELQRQANPNIVIALVGNKVDLVRPSTSETELSKFEPSTPTSPAADDEADDATATPDAGETAEDPDSGAASESRRQVPREEAEAYAKECGLLFFETSAKTGEGVVEVFTEIAKKIPIDHILASTRGPAGAGGRAGAGAARGGAAGGSVNLNEDEASQKQASSPFARDKQGKDPENMQEALNDVLVSTGLPTYTRSETYDSLLDAYSTNDDIIGYRQESSSPVKDKSQGLGLGTSANGTASASASASAGKGKARDVPERSSSKKKDTSGAGTTRKKDGKDVPFDVIDRLDISGLYGGGGLVRHDGPFAAATAARNKGPRAPMAAFDPSALAPPPAAASRPNRSPASSNSNLSARAQATLAAMDSEGGAMNGPYGAARPGMGRRNSTSSITLGFPAGNAGKGQQLIEVFGVRENEAWEDFGTSRWEPGTGSFANSRESVVPAGITKDERMERAQSIWDIEATLKSGKPVGRKSAPPPVPVLPSEFANQTENVSSNSPTSKPKRSKSIVGRFRAGRKNPNNPMEDEDDSEGTGREAAKEVLEEPQPLGVRDENGGGVRFDSASPTSLKSSARFNGGSQIEGTRSLGQEGVSEGLGRRPSVMQRFFKKK
ncbi:hypothetical protein MNV49_002037 [Pseudohyphozyma bogoriensis]|nr:hypothetical protein MNV49_002037 [Pseudohyphozyma bogoriensis]